MLLTLGVLHVLLASITARSLRGVNAIPSQANATKQRQSTQAEEDTQAAHPRLEPLKKALQAQQAQKKERIYNRRYPAPIPQQGSCIMVCLVRSLELLFERVS